MKKKIFVALIALFIALGTIGCGYFESVLTGVSATPSFLSGRVVDSLSGNAIEGAAVELIGSTSSVIVTGGDGSFNFYEATTGKKRLVISMGGYRLKSMDFDLSVDGSRLDTIRLVRHNDPPLIERSLYPMSRVNAPLTIRFVWSFSDYDIAKTGTIERHRYRFYFGRSSSPSLVDSGEINLSAARIDTVVRNRIAYFSTGPDTVFKGLLPLTMYYYKIVLVDAFNDSAIFGVDSFITRAPFSQGCPNDMALVEVNNKTFCMDKREFSNERYATADTSFSIADDITTFSIFTNTPVVNIDYERAEAACLSEGKRLCKISEWEAALGGYEGRLYPYGNTYVTGQIVNSLRSYTSRYSINTPDCGVVKVCITFWR